MSYTIEDGLSPRPKTVEFADFWEVECLRKADLSASIIDIVKAKGIVEDIQEQDNDTYDFELEEEQIKVVEEIQRRIKACQDKYPFKLDDKGYVLSLDVSISHETIWIYLYLLFATRNNMTSNKTLGGIDGTKVFEKLSMSSITTYLGEHSKGFNFGTATSGGFYDKLDMLTKHINEGALHNNGTAISYVPQDDKVDIVAWIPFSDLLPSKIICFAQCKTGTHWHGTIKQLNVSDFLKKWFSKHTALDPIATFIISDVLPVEDYFNRSVNNLFLDRCRVASMSKVTTNNDWYSDLTSWTKELAKQQSFLFLKEMGEN